MILASLRSAMISQLRSKPITLEILGEPLFLYDESIREPSAKITKPKLRWVEVVEDDLTKFAREIDVVKEGKGLMIGGSFFTN